MPRRTPSAVVVRRLTRAVATAIATAVVAGCSGGSEPPAATPKPTPIASYDGTVAQVERVSFCSRIDDQAVADAAGTEVTTAQYGNGERLPGTQDVSHEYGCVFTGTDVVARSWVFVPPVTPARAAQLVVSARKMPGCTTVPAAKFGSPALGTLCRSGGRTTVTYRGLFGDAWLACSLDTRTTPDRPAGTRAAAEEELVTKAGIWCVRVATTATAPSPSS